MSRSFKHTPMMAICGGASAKQDKRLAARGYRRACNHAIANAIANQQNFENFLLPALYEAAHNETYCWNRDGGQMWQGLDAEDWYRHLVALRLVSNYWYHWYRDDPDYMVWPPRWYKKMMRK